MFDSKNVINDENDSDYKLNITKDAESGKLPVFNNVK